MTAAWRARVAWAAAAVCGAPAVGAAQGRAAPAALAGARQLVLVTAEGWDATTGTLRRYTRAAADAPWRAAGAAVPVTLGRAGLAVGTDGAGAGPIAGGPAKREGDGRAPAGAFPLVAAFGFGAPGAGVRLPYRPVADGTVCVDDPESPLYNAVVDSAAAGAARWASAERMRRVAGYRQGVVVGYNGARVVRAADTVAAPGAPRPAAARGSCIFLHVWDGPGRPTAGCTAMDAPALAAVVDWLDPAARPVLVQLPAPLLPRARAAWRLP